eukprot:Em0013g744a
MPVLKRCLGPLYPNSRTFQQQGKYRPTPTPDTLGKSASNSMQYKLQLLLLYKGEVSVKSKDRRFCPFQPIDKHICWTGIAVDSQKTSASNFSFESLKIYKNCAIPNMTEQPKQQMEFYLATTAPVVFHTSGHGKYSGPQHKQTKDPKGCLGRMGILILLRSSYPATTSLQLGTHAAGSRCKPKPTEGTTESYELAESLASDLANRLSKVADVPVAPDDVQRSDKRSTSTRYDALVCELQTNETLRNTFYANVRQRYGVENSDNDANNTTANISDDNGLVITVAFCTGIAVLITILVLVLVILSCKCFGNRKKIEVHNPTISMVSQLSLAARDTWEFPRESLHIFQNRMLGKGAFGKVMQAQAEGIVHGNPEKDIVAVKTVKDSAPPGESSNLLDELELMKKVKPHSNIINLLGCCTTPGGPICLIIEYAIHGNLKSFLRSCEEAAMSLNHKPLFLRKQSYSSSCSHLSSTKHMLNVKTPNNSQLSSIPNDVQMRYISQPPPLVNQDSATGLVCISENKSVAHPVGISAQMTPPLTHDYLNCKGLVYMEDIQTFALQIASGLRHLELMEIVHCDLAARNILISEGFILKISDFGMARDISCKNYYRKCPQGLIPVKWTAPEALEEHLYTYKSDIWSFGIVLWEIFSYGHSPYPDMDVHTWDPFIQYLKNGNRPEIPDGCPLFFQDIMQQCWELHPECRPSCDSLMQAFSENRTYEECEYTQIAGYSPQQEMLSDKMY